MGAAQEATAYLDKMTLLLRGGDQISLSPGPQPCVFPTPPVSATQTGIRRGLHYPRPRLSPKHPPHTPSLPPASKHQRHYMRKSKRKKHEPKSTLFTLSQEGSPIRVLHSGHHRTLLSLVCSFVSVSFNKMLSAAFYSSMCAFQIKLLVSEHYKRLKSNENYTPLSKYCW